MAIPTLNRLVKNDLAGTRKIKILNTKNTSATGDKESKNENFR